MTDPMLGRRRPGREAAMAAKLRARTWAWAGGPFEALGFSFTVRTSDRDMGEYLGLALAPLAGRGPAEHAYSLVDHGPRRRERYVLYLDGRYLLRTGGASSAVLSVLWHVNRSVVRESPRYVLIHASGAAWRDQAIVFPAQMESGKTTLVAGLLQRGLSYLSDEAIAIDPASGLAYPYPKALSIDPGSWEVLGALRPELVERLSAFATSQWQVDPRTIRPDVIAGPSHVTAVISPRYTPGEPTRLEPISRADGVRVLVENAFNFERHGASGLDTLAAVVRGAECYLLGVGALDDACDAVIAVVTGCAAPS